MTKNAHGRFTRLLKLDQLQRQWCLDLQNVWNWLPLVVQRPIGDGMWGKCRAIRRDQRRLLVNTNSSWFSIHKPKTYNWILRHIVLILELWQSGLESVGIYIGISGNTSSLTPSILSSNMSMMLLRDLLYTVILLSYISISFIVITLNMIRKFGKYQKCRIIGCTYEL